MEELTGNFYFTERLFGGFNVMVEFIKKDYCHEDGTFGPEYTYYRKATMNEIQMLGLKSHYHANKN